MSYTYETRYGDTLRLSRCDTPHGLLARGHLTVIAATASGSSIAVCIDAAGVPALTSEMRAWARPGSGALGSEETLEAYRQADREVSELEAEVRRLREYRSQLADEISTATAEAGR